MDHKYITVTALTKYIKKKMDIDPHLQQIWLKGEISNFKHHHRGHMYMTIKDEQTKIAAVMFFSHNQRLPFTPENGMHVLIEGEVTVFEAFGQYQLYIHHMQPDGIGALYLAYEQLKEKLTEQGYFSDQHKRAIKKFPKHIGIITSPTGAAVRDIITTIKRRYPIVQLTVIPVLVQGDTAKDSIYEAIKLANEWDLFDTLIVARGGGSIEDLWAFNEEKVVKAIFHSQIPIISGIGHETDYTISDFSADLRAPTPTGAAELAVPSIVDVQATIQHIRTRLLELIQYDILEKSRKLQALKQSYAFHKPAMIIKEKEQQIDRLMDRLTFRVERIQQQQTYQLQQLSDRLYNQNPNQKMIDMRKRAGELIQRQNSQIVLIHKHKQQYLQSLIHRLTLLNPLEIMKRGFAVPYTSGEKIAKSAKQLQKQDILHLKMVDGTVICTIDDIWEDKDEKK